MFDAWDGKYTYTHIPNTMVISRKISTVFWYLSQYVQYVFCFWNLLSNS